MEIVHRRHASRECVKVPAAIFLNQNPLGDHAGVGITLRTPSPFVNKVTDFGDCMSPNYGLKSYSFVNFSLSRRTMTIPTTGASTLSATSSHLSGHIRFVFSYETKHNIGTITWQMLFGQWMTVRPVMNPCSLLTPLLPRLLPVLKKATQVVHHSPNKVVRPLTGPTRPPFHSFSPSCCLLRSYSNMLSTSRAPTYFYTVRDLWASILSWHRSSLQTMLTML